MQIEIETNGFIFDGKNRKENVIFEKRCSLMYRTRMSARMRILLGKDSTLVSCIRKIEADEDYRIEANTCRYTWIRSILIYCERSSSLVVSFLFRIGIILVVGEDTLQIRCFDLNVFLFAIPN